jgi:hypothetical protein
MVMLISHPLRLYLKRNVAVTEVIANPRHKMRVGTVDSRYGLFGCQYPDQYSLLASQ